eukprot:2324997-Rhodomonas_salina.1
MSRQPIIHVQRYDHHSAVVPVETEECLISVDRLKAVINHPGGKGSVKAECGVAAPIQRGRQLGCVALGGLVPFWEFNVDVLVFN